MEDVGLLLCTQEHAIEPYPEPVESNTLHFISQFLKVYFKYGFIRTSLMQIV